MLAAVLAALQRLHLADRLLLGHVGNGTGVQQHDIGALFRCGEIVTPTGQVARTCSESRTFIWQP